MDRLPPHIQLSELNKKIKGLLKKELDTYWIIAEIGEIKVNYSGHCYLDLVEKVEDSGEILSRARATIWSNTFRMIRPYFESSTNKSLEAGLKVMVRVAVEYHEVYGLSLNIFDIEPSYTVGELIVRKQKIIQQLIDEGVADMNKELPMPELPQRIAVISSQTAAGYEDFVDQLKNNIYGYQFYIKLFPTIMQGNEAEASVIHSLDRIYEHEDQFDLIAIIRGGGAQADLDCFNSYWMGYHVAQMPLPVITGIGHEQDDTVVDYVAHTRLKTPTAVAAYLIELLNELDSALMEVEENIVRAAQEKLNSHSESLVHKAYKLQKAALQKVHYSNKLLIRLPHRLYAAVRSFNKHQEQGLQKAQHNISQKAVELLKEKTYILQEMDSALKSTCKEIIQNQKHKLDLKAQTVDLMDPKKILERGYSITYKGEQLVHTSNEVEKGDELTTITSKGKIQSQVK